MSPPVTDPTTSSTPDPLGEPYLPRLGHRRTHATAGAPSVMTTPACAESSHRVWAGQATLAIGLSRQRHFGPSLSPGLKIIFPLFKYPVFFQIFEKQYKLYKIQKNAK
jgi:hypothetical protein